MYATGTWYWFGIGTFGLITGLLLPGIGTFGVGRIGTGLGMFSFSWSDDW